MCCDAPEVIGSIWGSYILSPIRYEYLEDVALSSAVPEFLIILEYPFWIGLVDDDTEI